LRNINKEWIDFGDECRNLRLELCTDDMNPYGNMSSHHSTWSVLLCIHNFPPWLCMKRKYMMLSLLISGPKQLGNDIDMYLQPLLKDLDKLWKDGLKVF
jgi:Transposase family tnp2